MSTKTEKAAKTTSADAPATEKKLPKDVAAKMIDPLATSPSNDKTRTDEDKATATELNSKQRVAEKVSRTGRNNGGDGGRTDRPGVGRDMTPDTLGEREAVSPADTDVIWTNSSKDRWGVDQPSLGDLLSQRDKVNADLAEAK